MNVPGCISCDVLAGPLNPPGGVIYEDAHWHADSVLSPVLWRGFLILKLKRHCEHLAELTPQESAALGPAIQALSAALMEVLDAAKIYVCSFGDGVQHVHLWLLPRPKTMRPGKTWVLGQLDIRYALYCWFRVKRWLEADEETAQVAERLRQALAGRTPPAAL